MTVIVRDFKQHEISEDELRLLLSFVEEDIYDYHRQSTAFPLLKVLNKNIIFRCPIKCCDIVIDDLYDMECKLNRFLLICLELNHKSQSSLLPDNTRPQTHYTRGARADAEGGTALGHGRL